MLRLDRRVFERGSTKSLCWSLAVVLTTGCTGPQNASSEREQSNLKPLAILYGQFMGQHRGQPPKNIKDFKEFAASKSEMLNQFKVANADALLTSSRDGEPYIVVFGKASGPPGPGGAPVIAYEQTGKDGKRWIATSIGAVAEVDEAEFRRLVPDAK